MFQLRFGEYPAEGLVKPYIILERFGLRIGVFGLGAKPDGLIQADKCEKEWFTKILFKCRTKPPPC